jgi:hypothetical protein
MYPSCSVIQEKVISNALMIDLVWKFLPRWVRLSLTLEFEKVFFLFDLPLELLNQENRVIRRHTSRAMKRNQILQGAMSPMHRRKGGMGEREVLHLTVLISSFLHDQCALYRFLCFPLPFVNLGTRFLLRGRVVTSRVTEILIKLLKLQLRHQASTNQVVKV